MNKNNNLSQRIIALIKKSKRALLAAREHNAKGDYDFASSKAYYAVFYAMESILLTKKLSFSKHSGTISAFNQHFIKTGIFPKDFSKKIERLSNKDKLEITVLN